MGVLLHGVGFGGRMHQAVRNLPFPDGGNHFRIEGAAGDIVDHAGARLQSSVGHGGTVGVDGEHRLREVGTNGSHRLHNPRNLLFFGNFQRVRARGHRPDVNDVAALRKDLRGTFQNSCLCRIFPSVIERIFRDVKDAHDEGRAGIEFSVEVIHV